MPRVNFGRTDTWQWLLIALAGGTFAAARAEAADHVLTIGGGYSPSGNQISLEKNVLFFQRLLAQQRPEGVPHEIFFSDGASPGRDLQFADPAAAAPPANERMARLFGNRSELGMSYRSHQIPGVQGTSSRQSLDRWFQEIGAKLTANDRLLIYVTAHGGKAKDGKRPYNTRLHLWNDEEIQVGELAAHLDKLPRETTVVVVMVQCYSGGFSHLIFNEGDAEKGLAAHNRCGFFATVHDRPAAGCTPDIDEEDYHEYSSYFLAGLGSKTRLDRTIESPDYNGDGVVSFEEAHGYVELASHTIDIPVRTSDAFLRTYSKTSDKDRNDLVTADAPPADLAGRATPTERAVLAGLAVQLELPAEGLVAAARKLAETIEQQRKELADERNKKDEQAKELKRQVQRDLKQRWPELSNLLNPQVIELLTQRSAEFVEAVDSHRHYSELVRLDEESDQLQLRRLDLERRWVKCQRLLQTAERVALAANLAKFATPELQQRYQQLLSAEQGALRPK